VQAKPSTFDMDNLHIFMRVELLLSHYTERDVESGFKPRLSDPEVSTFNYIIAIQL
jgi:hypothetical protein